MRGWRRRRRYKLLIDIIYDFICKTMTTVLNFQDIGVIL